MAGDSEFQRVANEANTTKIRRHSTQRRVRCLSAWALHAL